MKMLKNNSIKGFTIIELLVALALTVMVFMISIYAVGLFKQSLANRMDKYSTASSFYLLKKLLKQDCSAAHEVTKDGDVLIFKVDNKVAETYVFEQSMVTRENLAGIDSFDVGALVTNLHIVSDSVKMISSFTVIFGKQPMTHETIFQKSYSSQQIITYLQNLSVNE